MSSLIASIPPLRRLFFLLGFFSKLLRSKYSAKQIEDIFNYPPFPSKLCDPGPQSSSPLSLAPVISNSCGGTAITAANGCLNPKARLGFSILRLILMLSSDSRMFFLHLQDTFAQ